MNRDPEKFPDDVNGDTLWKMQEDGDDLSIAREIEFTVIFPTEDNALEFGEALLINRQKILLCDNEQNDEYPFEIVVYVYMEPTYEEISGYEDLLELHAIQYNGYNDGWGCLEQK
jgi:regulator of ribonuclease activity B